MRTPPRALVVWIAAGTVAIATARLVATDLAELHQRARDLGPEQDVVLARHDLPLGAVVGADDLTTTRVYARAAPAGALHDRARVTGRVIAVPVLAGAAVLAGHLAEPDRQGVDGLVPPGHRAVRVITDDGAVPRPGEAVDVLATLDPVGTASAPATATVVARTALVLALDGAGERAEYAGPSGRGVTLLVTEPEARDLAFAMANGVLVLAVAPPEDACCKTSSSASSRD